MTSPNAASVGNVHADIVPDVTGFKDALKTKLEALNLDPVKVVANPDVKGFARKLKDELDAVDMPTVKVLAAPDVKGFNTSLKTKLDGLTTLEVKVNATPTVKDFNKSLKDALAALPDLTVKVNAEPTVKNFNKNLRDQLKALPDVTVKVNAEPTVKEFNKNLRDELKALPKVSVKVNVDPDVSDLVTKLNAAIGALPNSSVNVNVDFPNATAVGTTIGTAAATAFVAAFNAAIHAATWATPGPSSATSASAGGQAGGAYATAFRTATNAALRDLGPYRISLNRDPALAELNQLRRDIERLNGKTVGVDIDAVAALAEIDRIQTRLRYLSTLSPNIQVRADTASAALRLELLRRQLDSLGRDRINIGANGSQVSQLTSLISGASTQIGTLTAGVAAFGSVIVPVMGSATGAVIALTGSFTSLIAGAGVAVLAVSGIVGAVQALGQAHDASNKATAQGARENKTLANTADQVESALAGVAAAERGYTSAQRDALRAQQAINDAREEAAQDLEDLGFAVRRNATDSTRALYELREAKANLDAVLADPTSTQKQRDLARAAYEEAKLHNDELGSQAKRLAKQQEEAQRNGIEGSKKVVEAQERARDANERVAAAAEAIVSAHKAVEQAQRAASTATVTAANTEVAAIDDVKKKLAELSPVGREFAQFIYGLKDPLLALRREAETGFLPGLQSGISALLDRLPAVSDFISRVATGLGNIAEAAGRALAGDRFKTFFSYLDGSAVSTLESFSRALGNIAETLGNVIAAFAPFQRDMEGGLVSLTEKWAKWSRGLATDKGFQEFLDYVRTRGPQVVSAIGGIAEMIYRLMVAAAPAGDTVLGLINGITEGLNAIPMPVLIGLVSGMSALSAAVPDDSVWAAASTGLYGIAAAAGKTSQIIPLVSTHTKDLGKDFEGTGLSAEGFSEAIKGIIDVSGHSANALNAIAVLTGRVGDSQLSATDKAKVFGEALNAIGNSPTLQGATFNALSGALTNIADSSINARDKVRLLHQALDQVYGASIALNEAEERSISTRYTLTQQLQTNAYGFDLAKAKTAESSQAIIANRDALENQLQSLRENAVQQIAAGKTYADAKAELDKQIQSLLTSIGVDQNKNKAVGDLVATYGQLPPEKVTNVSSPGLSQVISDMIDAHAVQVGLAAIPPWSKETIASEARALRAAILLGPNSTGAFKADGGYISGPGGPRDDLIPAWLSNGEYVINAHATSKHLPLLERINNGQYMYADGGLVEPKITFATGGLVLPTHGFNVRTLPINIDVSKTYNPHPLAESWAQWEEAQAAYAANGSQYFNDVSQTAYKVAKSLGAVAKVVLALMEAGIVESGMRNLNYGDRDSLGFLQQRPSQGWPNPMDVSTATRSFVLRAMPSDKLHPNYTAGQLAQSVQRSAYPGRYDQVEPAARALIGALSGEGVASIGANGSPGFPPWPSSPSAQRGDSGVWRNIVALIKSTGPVSGTFGNAYRAGDPLWHGCVPMDTQILTRRGWITYSEVVPGEDETIGYNPATGKTEWTLIVGLHHYQDAEVWTLQNSWFRADVTPGHKWLVDQQVTVQTETVCTECGRDFPTGRGMTKHRADVHGILTPRRERYEEQLVATRDVKQSTRIHLAKPANLGGELPITDDEAELIGWIFADGYMEPYGPTIVQSKPEEVHYLKRFMARFPHSVYRRQPKGRQRFEVFRFALAWTYWQDLSSRSKATKAEALDFVLNLSPSQRQAFVRGFLSADGTRDPRTHNERLGYAAFQVSGPVAEAVKVAAYLEGYRPDTKVTTQFDEARFGTQPMEHIGFRTPIVKGRNLPVVAKRTADVWCPTTTLGTWTARQGEEIFLTGNSGRAVDWMGYQQDALATFLANHRPLELIHRTSQRDYAYTRGRNKGSFNNTLMEKHRNHVHIAMAGGGLVQVPHRLYDTGGLLPPGLTLADNRTGGMEYINTADEQRALVSAATGGRGGVALHIDNFNAYADQSPGSIAKDLYWEMKTRS